MANIADIRAFEVLDSRGNPTIQADVILDNGIVGTACSPQELQRGQERRSSFGMVTKAVILAKVCSPR